MPMSPRIRKLALTAHITSSVGWLGAVAAFLALAIAGLASADAQRVRAAYVAMELTGWFVIVPLCFASLATGFVMSLGTAWGLFRHYWVLAKLLIAVLATILLLVHMQPTGRVADLAAERTLASSDLPGLRVQLVADAAAAVVVLLVATVLSVFKPRGMTPYGQRKQDEQSGDVEFGRELTSGTPRWVYVSGIIVVVLVLVFVIKHLHSGGIAGHLGR